MKKIFSLFFFLMILFGYGQHQRFIYQVSIAQDSSVQKEFYHLDIHENSSIYYPRIHFENDSINKNAAPDAGYLVSGKPFYATKNQKVSYFELINIHLYEIEIKGKIDWKISDKTKKWEDYTLQKATTHFGGRTWEVWFANDIPISEGVLFLKGLPGLVVEAKDAENQYHLELIRIQKITEKDRISFLEDLQKRAVKIHLKQYKKLKKQFYDSPLEYFHQNGMFKNGTKPMLEDGTVLENMADVKNAEKRERKRIERNNNPPHLDFKIDYK